MTNFKTTIIAAILTLTATSAFAAESSTTPSAKVQHVVASSAYKVVAVKPAVLIKAASPTRRIVRVVNEPVSVPVVRKVTMNADKKFVYTSAKNTSTKTYRPATPRHASMPNLFKK